MNKTFVLIILLFNVLIYYFLIPYVQQDANSHMNSGPFFSVIFYILAITIITYAIIENWKYKNKTNAIELVFLALSFIYWG